MPNSFTGGCLCGAVRYECTSRPLTMLNCHCRDCQQLSGGPFTPVVYVPAKAFRVTKGEIRHYLSSTEGGGHNKRGFCATCGSRLTGAENDRGIGIAASSLDDPSWFRPKADLWVTDAQPWDHLDPALPKFDRQPPSKAKSET